MIDVELDMGWLIHDSVVMLIYPTVVLLSVHLLRLGYVIDYVTVITLIVLLARTI